MRFRMTLSVSSASGLQQIAVLKRIAMPLSPIEEATTKPTSPSAANPSAEPAHSRAPNDALGAMVHRSGSGATESARLHPAGRVADTNVVLAGTGSLTVALMAAADELFLKPIV